VLGAMLRGQRRCLRTPLQLLRTPGRFVRARLLLRREDGCRVARGRRVMVR
jgi:hypothetical protein